MEGKWGIQAHQTQEMKGKEGSGDPEGREAKSGLASSGRGLDTFGEKGVFADVPWRSQSSMSDSSTTARLTLDLIAGDCWARRRLRSGIKDVSVASKLMKSLALVGVGFIGILALPELDVRFLHDLGADSGSDCGRLLGSMPDSQ